MIQNVILWLLVLVIAFFAGRLVSKIKLPAILGWLITGMIFGPNAVGLLRQCIWNDSGNRACLE